MKSLKLFLLMAIAIFSFDSVKAQISEPVKWKAEVKSLGNNEFLVTYTATIDPTWTIYDLGPYVDGPMATTFFIKENPSFKLIGKITPVTKAKRAHDSIWGMEIGKYYTKAVFTQKVKLLAKGEYKFTANVEWQACDDTSCTSPIDEDLTVVLK